MREEERRRAEAAAQAQTPTTQAAPTPQASLQQARESVSQAEQTAQQARERISQAAQTNPQGNTPAIPQSAQTAALREQAARTVQQSQASHADTGTFRGYLDQWVSAARNQATNSIDNAVSQGSRDLSRAQADAEKVFQEQQRQISADEARARDNQALYSAARGDRGGIGAAQYDAVANTAMQNRVAVNNARQELATNTQRQIADLRAQGEFQKADALLKITQENLSRLMALEQWAQEFNLGVDQFNAQLSQWAAQYNFQLQQADLSAWQFNQQLAFQREQFDWNRATDQRNYDRGVYESDRNYNRGVYESDRNYGFQRQQFDWNKAVDQRNFDRGVLESDRAYNRGVYESDRNYNRGVYESDRNYNRGVLESDRNYGLQVRQLDQAAKQFTESLNLDWAKLGLSKEQFAESVKQFWTQFDAQQKQQDTENAFRQTQFDAQQKQQDTENAFRQTQFAAQQKQQATENGFRQQQLAAQQQDYMAGLAKSLLNVGVMPSDDMLSTAQIPKDVATSYLAQVNAGLVSTSGKSTTQQMTRATAESMAKDGKWSDNVYDALLRGGYTEENIEQKYGNSSQYKTYMRNRSDATGPGLRTFEVTFNRIKEYLENGKGNDAEAAIKAIENRLNDRQRQRLNTVLDSYGYQPLGG